MKEFYKVSAYGQRYDINAPVVIAEIDLIVQAESIEEACQLARDYLKPVEEITPYKAELS